MVRRILLAGAFALALAVSLSLLAPSSADAAYDPTTQLQLTQDYQRLGYIIDWDEARGLPQRLLDARFGASSRGKYVGDPVQVSEAFLREHAALLFGRDSQPVFAETGALGGSSFELRVIKTRESLSGSQVIRQQYSNGVPIDGKIIQVNLSKRGEVMSAIDLVDPSAVILDPKPLLTNTSAVQITLANVDNPGALRAPARAQLVGVTRGGATFLAWKTEVPLFSPFSDQIALIDARSGEVLEQRDGMINCSHKAPYEPVGRIDVAPPVEQPDPANPNPVATKVDGSGDVLPANPLNDHPERYGLRDGDPVAGFVENKVLARLDGSGFLRGDYVDATNSDAPRANEASLAYNYSPDVVDGHFHEVNVYWHIDEFQNYIQTTLGIVNANNRQQPAAAHQGEDDNSSYSPTTGSIRYGDGGVDDSEDGEVVLHEYGHAIHDNISGIGGDEAGAISEGFGDYVACTFGGNPLEAEWDATAYNPGPPPFLRRIDGNKHYPEDLVGEVHADGEIIASAWWEIRQAIGAAIADQLCIESFFLVNATTTMAQMADAYVQADQALYGGAHLGVIFSAFGGHGIGPAYLLEIDHTPLGDTEDRFGPYAVNATILHTSPITGAGAVQMHWRMAGDPTFNDVAMTNTVGDDWAASIPGPGVDGTIEYYLSVVDDQAVSASLPADAPTGFFSFNVGTDLVPPVLVHTPLGDQPLLVWPATVRATVTDNLGVSSVTCSWSLNGVPQSAFPLFVAGGDDYAADFPVDASMLSIGDTIEYSILAVDGSSAANSVSAGPYTFSIIDAKGVVLVIDDDNSAKAGEDKQLDDKSWVTAGPDRDPQKVGASATQMAAALTAAGYVVTVETPATTDPTTWGSYSFLVSSSGATTSPLADAAYRAALVSYAQAGGKLVVEGGEVGFDAASSPGYPEIVADVIHAFDWDGDESGPLVEVAGQEFHPIRTTPNPLPASIPVTYTGNYGDQDSVKPSPEAYLVYGTTDQPANAGVLVFDDNTAPASAQIVYCAFAMAQVTDPAQADALIVNIAEFLLADEGVAGASISGQVLVQNRTTHAGVTVSAGGASAVTDHDGHYTLTGLFAGTYTVTAGGLTGWETASQVVGVGDNEAVTGVDFELRPVADLMVCNNAAVAIPDDSPAGITSEIVVTDAGTLAEVDCSVDITHTWSGDLIVELTSPSGTTVRLHNRTGGSADDVIANYDVDTAPDGPGTMADFVGEAVTGTWTLFMSDNAAFDTGNLNSWCLDFSVVQDGAVPTLVSGLTARNVEEGVELSWTASPSQDVAGFRLRRAVDGHEDVLNSKPLLAVKGGMSFVDRVVELEPGTELTYWLEAVLENGRVEPTAARTTLEYAPVRPTVYRLEQNSPNPFNPSTTIRFALVQRGRTSLRIYDLAGRLVAELLDEEMGAGPHSVVWEGLDQHGAPVATGTYLYQIRSGRFVETRRMVLVK